MGVVREHFGALAVTWKAVPRLMQHVASKSNVDLSSSDEICSMRSVSSWWASVFLAICVSETNPLCLDVRRALSLPTQDQLPGIMHNGVFCRKC